jgi:hypothetical protein
VAAALLGPATVAVAVAAAVAELVHIVLITMAVLLGLGAASLAACVAVRVHRWRTGGTTLVSLPAPPPWRTTAAPREPQQVTSGQPRAIEQHVHHHWHGVSAEDVAAAIRSQQEDQP